MAHEPSNDSISTYQTPDGVVGKDGKFVRPQGRYTGNPSYDNAQQDSILIVEDAPDLKPGDMEKSFSKINKNFESFQGSGTTATVAHISKDGKLTVAHVGDSPVNIYVRDPQTGQIVSMSTLTKDHSAVADAKMPNRGGNGQLNVVDGRADGRLMLGRAFGDNEIQGISAKPDIIQADLNPYFKKGYEVIVTVESDGAFENTTNSQRRGLIENTLNKPGGRKILAETLGRYADSRGSTDNISSMAIILKEPPKKNTVMGVFDGHGSNGATASKRAKTSFSNHFEEQKKMQFRQQRARTPEPEAGNTKTKAGQKPSGQEAAGRKPVEQAAPGQKPYDPNATRVLLDNGETMTVEEYYRKRQNGAAGRKPVEQAAPGQKPYDPNATQAGGKPSGQEAAGGKPGVHSPPSRMAQGVSRGVAAWGLVQGGAGVIDSYKNGDTAGVVVNGANVALSATDLTMDFMSAAGKRVLPTLGKSLVRANVLLTVGTAIYDVAKADGNFIDDDGSMGNKSAQVLESGVTAGVALGTGAVAVAVGTVSTTVVAAPVVAAIAAGYTAQMAHENWKAYRELDKETEKNFKAGKIAGIDKKLGETPSVYKYKNLPAAIGDISKNMRDENLSGKVERTADGYIKNPRQLDLNDPKNIREYERALDLEIQNQEKIMADNDSSIPRWIRWGNSANKYDEAKVKLAQFRAAKQELESYKKEKAEYSAQGGKNPEQPRPAGNGGGNQAAVNLLENDTAKAQAYMKFLGIAGVDPGAVDGVRGPQTDAALRAYAKKKGISIEGADGDPVSDQDFSRLTRQLKFDVAMASTPGKLKELSAQTQNGNRDAVRTFQFVIDANGGKLDRYGADGIRGNETNTAYEQALINKSIELRNTPRLPEKPQFPASEEAPAAPMPQVSEPSAIPGVTGAGIAVPPPPPPPAEPPAAKKPEAAAKTPPIVTAKDVTEGTKGIMTPQFRDAARSDKYAAAAVPLPPASEPPSRRSSPSLGR